jgi:hypothetical protein
MQHPSDIADVEPDEAAVGDRLRYRIDRACDGGKCRIEDRGRGRRSKPAVGEPSSATVDAPPRTNERLVIRIGAFSVAGEVIIARKPLMSTALA